MIRVVLMPTKAGVVAQSQKRVLGLFWRRVHQSVPHRSMGDLFTDLARFLTDSFGQQAGHLGRAERKRIAEAAKKALVRKMAR